MPPLDEHALAAAQEATAGPAREGKGSATVGAMGILAQRGGVLLAVGGLDGETYVNGHPLPRQWASPTGARTSTWNRPHAGAGSRDRHPHRDAALRAHDARPATRVRNATRSAAASGSAAARQPANASWSTSTSVPGWRRARVASSAAWVGIGRGRRSVAAWRAAGSA